MDEHASLSPGTVYEAGETPALPFLDLFGSTKPPPREPGALHGFECTIENYLIIPEAFGRYDLIYSVLVEMGNASDLYQDMATYIVSSAGAKAAQETKSGVNVRAQVRLCRKSEQLRSSSRSYFPKWRVQSGE